MIKLTPEKPPYYELIDGTRYKIYTALLNQEGINPPTAIIIQNTLNETLTYEYETTGSYFIKSATGQFKENKTIIDFGTPTTQFTGNLTIQGAIRVDDETVNIVTFQTPTDTRLNDRLQNTPITIKIKI